MRILGAVKLLVGLGIVVYLIVESRRKDAHFEANERPKEALRQAKDVCGQWSDGFTMAASPTRPLARAEKLLGEVEASGADEPIREEARRLQEALSSRPHYLRVAANAPAFEAEAPRYLALHAAAADGKEIEPKLIPAGLLPVTIRRSPGVGETEAFVDAELVNACGPAAAASPAEVKTLITFAWGREQIGEYRVTELEIAGQKTKHAPMSMPPAGAAYRQSCTATLIRIADGATVGRRRFEADDPSVRSSRNRQPMAEAQVRKKLVEFLADLKVAGA